MFGQRTTIGGAWVAASACGVFPGVLLAQPYSGPGSGGPAGPYVIRYVDADAQSGGNGQSWNTAYNDLESALSYARGHTVNEIRVGGEADPSPDVYSPSAGTGRNKRFELVPGVWVRGGFAGQGEFNPDLFNPLVYISLLSGEIGQTGLSDNCYHVVGADGNAAPVGPTTILEGFRISAGYANGSYSDDAFSPDAGGGLHLWYAEPTIRRCHFTGNYATRGGGAFRASKNEGFARFVRCRFNANYTLDAADPGGNSFPAGGGLASWFGELRVINCLFRDNGHDPADPPDVNLGGGAHIRGGDSPDGTSVVRLVNCLFHDNGADKGAGVYFAKIIDCEVLDCTLSQNDAQSDGGGFHRASAAGDAFIRNCIAYENRDTVAGTPQQDEQAQIFDAATPLMTVTYTCVQGLTSWPGNGNISGDPLFVSPGTPNFNSRLGTDSPSINTGHNSDVPADEGDLDGDTNTTEVTPVDLDDLPRFSGSDVPARVDMGAFEFQGTESTGPGAPPFARLQEFMHALISGDQRADANHDGVLDVRDILAFHYAAFRER